MTDEINLAMVIEKLRKGVCRRVTEGRPAVVVDIEETERFMGSVADILALLSTSPLALGGQQGVDRGRVEAIVREAVIAASVDVPDKFADRAAMRFEITQNATDAIVSALSTTPARAEAQDEGAAGELRAILRNVVAHATGGSVLNGDELGLNDICCRITHIRNKVYLAGKESAHPSPTPAADADRVRIAVEALERCSQLFSSLRDELAKQAPGDHLAAPRLIIREGWAIADEALAALKSEGK